VLHVHSSGSRSTLVATDLLHCHRVNAGFTRYVATRVVLESVDHATCGQRKRGRSLREPTHANHAVCVGESNLFESCTGKRGVKQPLELDHDVRSSLYVHDCRVYGTSFLRSEREARSK
jgi:hypothetical protein